MSNRHSISRMDRNARPRAARLGFLLSFLLFALWLAAPAYPQNRIVITPEDDLALDTGQRTAIVDAVCAGLNEVYVFPDKAREMEALVRGKLKSGEYDREGRLVAFTQRLTADLRSVSRDRHLAVVPVTKAEAAAGREPREKEEQDRLAELRHRNFGFEKVERLPGNIGYLDLRAFIGAEAAGPTAVAAMNFLANCDALIFDLRQNGGGDPSLIQLISSYLFEEPVHLNSFYIRRTDSTKQFWTHAHVEGARLADVPVYVLTSRTTFSGAEEFAYNLQQLKRATIVGETTGGGAHPVEFKTFEDLHIRMSLPFGRAVNPITNTNWEQVGVEPDIATPAAEALDRARLEAMKVLIEKHEQPEMKARLEWAMMALEAEQRPITLGPKELEEFAGTFGPRRIWLEGDTLFYQREGREALPMKPLAADLFGLDGLEYFRIRFERDESGKVATLVGLYDNGSRDANERTGS